MLWNNLSPKNLMQELVTSMMSSKKFVSAALGSVKNFSLRALPQFCYVESDITKTPLTRLSLPFWRWSTEEQAMAVVVHKYERDSAAAAEKEQRRAEQARFTEAEAKRKEAEKRAASRSAHRGAAGLRRERTAHEKLKRMRLEMEVAAQRGELIEREVVLRQAAFLLTAMRSRCMSAPGAWARRLVNISDPREMVELLREMMTNILEELADLPEKVTANPDSIGNGDAEPLARLTEGRLKTARRAARSDWRSS